MGVGLAGRWRFWGRQQSPAFLSGAIRSLFPSAASSPLIPPSPWQATDGSSQALHIDHLWSHLKVMLTPPSLLGAPLSCTSELCLMAAVGLFPTKATALSLGSHSKGIRSFLAVGSGRTSELAPSIVPSASCPRGKDAVEPKHLTNPHPHPHATLTSHLPSSLTARHLTAS